MAFREILNRPYYPPTSYRVCAWDTLVSPGRCSKQYIDHLAKDYQILGIPTDWGDAAVGEFAKGIRKSQDLGFQFGNYIGPPPTPPTYHST